MLPPGGRGPHGNSRSGLATLWNHSNPGHSTLSRMGSQRVCRPAGFGPELHRRDDLFWPADFDVMLRLRLGPPHGSQYPRPVDPETVEPGFLDDDNGRIMSAPLPASLLELGKSREQSGQVARGNLMFRHLLAAPRRPRCDHPNRTAEFERDENCPKIGADDGRWFGIFNRSVHGCLQSKWFDNLSPKASGVIHLPWHLQSDAGFSHRLGQ